MPDCALCRTERFHFDKAYGAVYYDGRAKELLRAFKFARRSLLEKPLLELLTRFIRENNIAGDWNGIVAVPMHPVQRFERGFNQAQILAEGVSKIFRRPFLAGTLKVNRCRRPQSSLGKAERKENVRNHFSVGPKIKVLGKKLLLVDDILTTGETASQCAKALKDAGAVSVDVLVVARGL